MKKFWKQTTLIALSVALLTCSLFSPIAAVESVSDPVVSADGRTIHTEISLMIDGFGYDGDLFTLDGTAYVALREFSCSVDNSVVAWCAEDEVASVWTRSLNLSAEADAQLIEANGRTLWCEKGVFLSGGKMYVPLRPLSYAFGFECNYSASDNTVYLIRRTSAIESAEQFYDENDLYWLSRIISAEAGAEPFEGKLAVGTVIMNRVVSDKFPDNITDVIFDSKDGVQFSPTANGSIYDEPTSDSVLAAKLTLEGVRLSDEMLFFLNRQLAKSYWIVENCSYVMTIGGHDFYS